MKKLLILLFLVSCVPSNSNVNPSSAKINFDDVLNFDDFNKLLIEYANKSPYPDISQ